VSTAFDGAKVPEPLVVHVPDPVLDVALKVTTALFAQTVCGEPALTTGVGSTTTNSVPALLVHPFTVTVTEYVPASTLVAPGMLVFCVEAVNPFGPVQEYVAPATKFDVRLIVEPSHTGLLLFAFGATGVGFTVTLTVAGALAQPLNTITV
jgi:hypothetical protein